MIYCDVCSGLNIIAEWYTLYMCGLFPLCHLGLKSVTTLSGLEITTTEARSAYDVQKNVSLFYFVHTLTSMAVCNATAKRIYTHLHHLVCSNDVAILHQQNTC